jgi:hypothetical protein
VLFYDNELTEAIMGWALARIGEARNAYRILLGKPLGRS